MRTRSRSLPLCLLLMLSFLLSLPSADALEASPARADRPDAAFAHAKVPDIAPSGSPGPDNATAPSAGKGASRFGPNRTSTDVPPKKHAYSPFDELVEEERPFVAGRDYESGQVLIKLKPPTTVAKPQTQGALTSQPSLNDLLKSRGVTTLSQVFPSIKPLTARVTATDGGQSKAVSSLPQWYRAGLSTNSDVQAVARALEAHPDVEAAEPVLLRRVAPANLPDSTTDPRYGDQWHLSAVRAPEAWQFLADHGIDPGGRRDIVVAVIDTGVDYNHPDLAGNMWVNSAEFNGSPGVDDDGNGIVDDVHGANLVSNERTGDPNDDHGHGTHVAGIVAASGNNGIGVVGVAYNVQIMAIKAAQYSGVLSTTDIAEAIYYAADKGADVINMSFGGYFRSQLEEDALAVGFGQAVLVAAAGNHGLSVERAPNIPRAPMYPAAYNWVLGVMARAQSPDEHGNVLAGFSNRDPFPRTSFEYELMAPGVDILSTLPNGQYASWDGTSMAAPVVSGLAALVRSYFWDKDVYSSRFIMGQMANAGADGYAALTTFPEPKLHYLEHWLFDTTAQNAANDTDGIVDAGETIDLAIVVRNHWGKADNVTVNLRAWAQGAFQEDPFVTMITGSVDYGAIGSFNWDDNGLIYDAEGAITGVNTPFRFTVSPDTPNDHIIPLLLTMTARNGLDQSDTTTYTSQARFELMVQRGRELPRIINGAELFGDKTDYPVGNRPASIAHADLNNDGFSDIVTANSEQNAVNVLLNDGNGGFTTLADYAVDSHPTSVAAADFDGDSYLDLAVANFYSGSISILLNSGAGTFGPKNDIPGFGSLRSVAAADLNGDGHADIAAALSGASAVGVLLNDGTGDFDRTDFVVGSYPIWIVSADLNNDSSIDLVTANNNGNSISVLLNNGNGTFTGKTDYQTGAFPNSLAAADFNGDGALDIAAGHQPVGSGTGRSVSVLNNNGDGTFQTKIEYALSGQPYSVAAADFNSDSRPDLAVARTDGKVSFLVNNGDSGFWAKWVYTTGSSDSSVTVADFDGDLAPDLVVADAVNNTVSFLPNLGTTAVWDFILTPDYYWILPDQTLIEANAWVKIKAGTQAQFWSANPSDPYNQDARAFVQVEGTLLVEGTAEASVELFPDALYPDYAVDIRRAGGSVELYYVRTLNPRIQDANVIDHGYFNQDVPGWLRYANGMWMTSGSPLVEASSTSNSIFHKLGGESWESAALPVNRSPKSSLFDSNVMILYGTAEDNVFLKNSRLGRWGGLGVSRAFAGSGSPGQFRNNSILNAWWDPNVDHWMQFHAPEGRDNRIYIDNNFWGTTSTTIIDADIYDYNDNFNLGQYIYQPILTIPAETTYPFVWKVEIVQGGQNLTRLGPGETTFTVTFNRDMDTYIQPSVSFGPDTPVTDYTVHPVNGGWQDPRTWVGTFNINPITGDGYQLMRIAGPARAANDPWLVIGDDSGRFRFEVITSGTEAMNLQATGGEGYVDLMWTQDDFDLLAGYNLFRSTSADGAYTRLNQYLIPASQKTYRDTGVQPGQTYYYKFTVVKTDMTESAFSNVAAATPIDTIVPVITHTPVSSAAVGLPLSIYADVTDNVRVASVTLYHRPIGGTNYQIRSMAKTTGNRYSATLEGSLLAAPGIEYYIEASDGISIVRQGRADNPYRVTITDSPQLTAVVPNHGPASGGTPVMVSGSNFKTGASVTFGGAVANDVTVVSGNQLTAVTPPHLPAVVDVSVSNPGGGSGSLLRGFTYESETVSVSLPDISADTGAIIEAPISVSGVSGLLAADVTVQFNSSVLAAQGARKGALANGFSIEINTSTPGQLRVSLASATAVTGSGVLAYLQFQVIGAPTTATDLTLASVSLNDGAIPVALDHGSVTVSELLSVSGQVRYYQNGQPVPGVLLTLAGNQSLSATTDQTGAYTVGDVPNGSYTLTPGKSDDTGAITAYDASLILQSSARLINLSGSQQAAADVDKSGIITAMDAAYVLQKSAQLIELPFPGAGKVWEFSPSARTLEPLTSDVNGLDFTAILIGDVSGNWGQAQPQGSPQPQSVPPAARLALGHIRASPSSQVAVPVVLTLDSYGLYSADIVLTYDSSVASVASVVPGDTGDAFGIAVNLNRAGEVRIAMAGATPLTTDGALLVVTFNTSATYGAVSPLGIPTVLLNEGSMPVELQAGKLTVAIKGDVDINGDVDISDLVLVASNFGRPAPSSDERADLNGDGVVDVMDLVSVGLNFGRSRTPGV